MRDDFSEEVKRILANRVGHECSNPDCRALTSGPQSDSAKALNVGVAAHITDASQGGPRFNPSLSSEQRCHADNGIWLCQNCAKLVDNDVVRYSEALLRAWKEVAEDRARNSVGKTTPPQQETESERKRRAIRPYIGKIVTYSQMATPEAATRIGPKVSSTPAYVRDCDEFVVRIGTAPSDINNWSRSTPLRTSQSVLMMNTTGWNCRSGIRNAICRWAGPAAL